MSYLNVVNTNLRPAPNESSRITLRREHFIRAVEFLVVFSTRKHLASMKIYGLDGCSWMKICSFSKLYLLLINMLVMIILLSVEFLSLQKVHAHGSLEPSLLVANVQDDLKQDQK